MSDLREAPPAPAAVSAPGGTATVPPKRRGCLNCCLVTAAVPLAALLALVIWLSLGPSPAPADCLPPDAPVRVTVRDPAELAEEFRTSGRWRELRGKLLPEAGGEPDRSKGPGRWMLRRFLGGEAAVALGADGKPILAAGRPGMLVRAVERLSRLASSADADGVRSGPRGKFYYGFIGKTAVVSQERSAVAAALSRREEILKAPAPAGAAADARIELAFNVPLREGARTAETLAFLLDLPRPAAGRGWLRADREILKLAGHADVVPGKPEALPPPLPEAGPASARLAPPDALIFWAWSAPAGKGRFSAAGRMDQLARALGQDAAGLKELVNHCRTAGVDIDKLLGQEMTGERALVVAGQSASDGKPHVAAASLLLECRDPAAAWPAARKMLEVAWGPVSPDGKPSLSVGQPVYPHLARRSHAGADYVELVIVPHETDPGFRPAFGVAGKFLVCSTSRAELERIMDRAAGRSPGFAWPRASGGRPVAALLVSPQRRGSEMTDLVLAVAHAASDPGKEPTRDDELDAAKLGAVISEIKSLRLDWLPAEGGQLRLELSAEAAGAGPVSSPAGSAK